MKFEWDEAKNRATFENTVLISLRRKKCSAACFLVSPDTREDYGEKRWIGIGHDSERRCLSWYSRSSPEDHSHHFIEKGKS